jgi:pyruvate dehydrogenase E1 component alpha subunit
MSQLNEQLAVYRKLLLARLAEERIREDYFKDEMKTPVHLGIGCEGIGVGVLHAMPQGTLAFATYRIHTVYLTLSENTDEFFGEMFGKETGCAKGKAGSMHLSCPESGFLLSSAVVGTTIPPAVGCALSQKMQGTQKLTVVFFGDGAVEEGAFWESLNFACHQELPIVFVCEDNTLAIHTAKDERRGFKSMKDVAAAFNCYYAEGSGTDVEEVIAMTRRALDQMKTKPAPALLTFNYHRFLQHVGPLEDYDAGYRNRPANEKDLDPVKNFEVRLQANGATPAQLNQIRDEVSKKIEASVVKARTARFAELSELTTHVWK